MGDDVYRRGLTTRDRIRTASEIELDSRNLSMNTQFIVTFHAQIIKSIL